VRFGIDGYKHHNFPFGQVKVDDAYTCGLALSRTRPSDFARAVCASNHITRLWMVRKPTDKGHPIFFPPHSLSACFWNVGVSMTVRIKGIIRESLIASMLMISQCLIM
jgi:hypothetical protein